MRMGKQGPCYHCGVTSTPLWRNGPPGKPVLCNACGSRWRTKGTLDNYTPGYFYEDRKPHQKRVKAHTLNPLRHFEGCSEGKTTKQNYGAHMAGTEDETSNRSGSGSEMSDSGKSVQLGSMDGIGASGRILSAIHQISIPKRKRTARIYYTPTPVEHLQKSLFEAMRDPEFSHLRESAEDVLIYECQNPLSWPEVGLGTILIKPPKSSAEEESVGSSLILENRIRSVEGTHVPPPIFGAQSQSIKINADLGVKDVSTLHQWTPTNTAKNFSSSVHNLDAQWSSLSSQRSSQNKPSSENLQLEKEISSHREESQTLLPTKAPLGPPGFQKYQAGSPFPTKTPLCRPSLQKSGVKKEGSSCFSTAVGAGTLIPTIRPFGPPISQASGAEKETSSSSCCTVGVGTLLSSKRPQEQPNTEASKGMQGSPKAQYHGWTNSRPPMNRSSLKDFESVKVDRVPPTYVQGAESHLRARYASVVPIESVARDIAGSSTSNGGVSSMLKVPLSLPVPKEETHGAFSCTPRVPHPGKACSGQLSSVRTTTSP